MGVDVGIEVAAGALPTPPEKTCVLSGFSTGVVGSNDCVGAGVSVGAIAAIDLLSPSEVSKANTRPTANIAAITPMMMSIVRPKDVLSLVTICYYGRLFRFTSLSSLETL
jgi:hypothetical protein